MEEQTVIFPKREMDKMLKKGFSVILEYEKQKDLEQYLRDVKYMQQRLGEVLGIPKEFLGEKAR